MMKDEICGGQLLFLVHAHGGTLPEQHCGAENEGLGPLGASGAQLGAQGVIC